MQRPLNRYAQRLLFIPPYMPDLKSVEKLELVKILRQSWIENNLPKIFDNIGSIYFIVD